MIYQNIRTKILMLLAALALSCPQDVRAQHLQASLSHYTTDDGLPSSAISSIVKDDYGFIWISTWNGLVRYDGYNFYTVKTGIASGIRGLHNRVANATVDQAQNIWMKMYDGRMFVINRQNDRIEDPMEGVGGHEDFVVDYFFNPYVSSNGDIIISYGKDGLYKLRFDRNSKTQDNIVTNGLTVTCLVGGYKSDIWAGTEQGVRRINMPNLSLERKGYLLEEHITQLATNGYNIFAGTKSGKIYRISYGEEPKLLKEFGREITGLFVDSHGLIWFSDLGDGAYYMNPETGTIKFFSQRVLSPEFTSRGAEFSEALGVVWVRMNHGGYGYYNREADEVEYFHNDPSNPWNLSNTVNAVLEMNDGVIWESTIRRGLEKLEVLKRTITRTLVMPESESPLDNEVRAMCYDKKHQLTFVCNKRGRIFVYDDKGNHVTDITHDANGNPLGRPYGMSVDSKGNYWVCDKDKGVFKVTPNGNGGFTVMNLHHDDNDNNSLNHNAAYQAVEDHKGNIWVATYGGGVNILRQGKDGKYTALHNQNRLKKYPTKTHQKVRTIAVDKQDNVWVGTTDGILIMNYNNGDVKVERMKEPEDLQKGLMSTDIVYLACDPSGTMWIGTNSGGLSYTTGQDDDGAWCFRNYGVQDGLPSEEIRSITFDERGNVWFATDHILCSFDVKKKIFTTFSQLDGVDDTMCSEGSAILGANENILFGTMNGFYTIDRKKLTTKTGSLLKLRITDFFLDDVMQSPRLTDTYDFYVPESKSVTIPKDAQSFAFRFAAMNYQLQHRLVYQYMLEGYDEYWQNADKKRMAVYTDLPSGTYTFKVKTFLLESPEAYDERTIEVVVQSRFLFSFWFWLLVILLLAGAVMGGWWFWKREKAQVPESVTYSDQPADAEEGAPKAENEEKTDEYEIIEG